MANLSELSEWETVVADNVQKVESTSRDLLDKSTENEKLLNDLHIINIKKDNITNSLLNTLVEMMKELRDTYDKNIDIKEESHD